jgi:hypothetical protein
MFLFASSIVAKHIQPESTSNERVMICNNGMRLARPGLHRPRPETWM